MPSYKLVRVSTPREMKVFVDLPWSLYADWPLWVPPLKGEVKKLLTPGKHPFWEFAERELFLLLDGGTPVGRIAAIIDHNSNDYHDEKAGKWGFFECIDDHDAARKLFDAAQKWLSERGMEYMHGPFNPSTNYEIGLLVDGFEHAPVVMMPYNPRYYPDLVESTGHVQEKDLYSYMFRRGHEVPKTLEKMSKRVQKKANLTFRRIDKSSLDRDMKIVNEIYRASWADNWGFVPANDAEIRIQAQELKPILDPDLAIFLCVDGEPVGVSVILPDANHLLKIFNGKLTPWRVIKALLNKPKIPGLRFILLGIKPGYRRMGVPLVAVDQLINKAYSTEQYQFMDVGWTLEDNDMVNTLIERFGGDHYKRFRIYRRDF